MPVMITVYGLPNCETVKKARAWLQERGVPHAFHDFRKQGLPNERLDAWLAALGWEALLNRRGTTWRQLDEATRAAVGDATSARTLMLARPSVIRRPVVEWSDAAVSVGFDPAEWSQRL